MSYKYEEMRSPYTPAKEEPGVNAFTEDRYKAIEYEEAKVVSWRMKVRLKTVCVGLIVALNIGVDPPDVLKPSNCARKECWTAVHTLPPSKALEQIGKNLQAQYEELYRRARYKLCLDPTVDDVKKLCLSLRRNAKDERILIHYNGHGVPKPTQCGEVWLFNKNFTQYIPFSLYDLQNWVGSPAIYVWDCSNAGQIVESFDRFAEQKRQEYEKFVANNPGAAHPPRMFIKDTIHFASCGINELLPLSPDLPADLLTSCLTTPLEVAYRCFALRNNKKLTPSVHVKIFDEIPGEKNNKKSMKGQLFWIYTAITDTIAWNILPKDVFQALFRQDLLVASLFRNFLLAERVMRSLNCTPISHPQLPNTHNHHLWSAWDAAVELSIATYKRFRDNSDQSNFFPFFADQLQAFDVCLQMGVKEDNCPEQLPIVLQALLSEVHRLRALQLLGNFLDLGTWAVNEALSVGIFPYVLKLLQSQTVEIRPVLCFIWCRILMVDKSCQADIIKESGDKYFANIIASPNATFEHKYMALFCLTHIVTGSVKGQEICFRREIDGKRLILLVAEIIKQDTMNCDSTLRIWALLFLGNLWDDNDMIRSFAWEYELPQIICSAVNEMVPEVRAAALFAIGTVFGRKEDTEEKEVNVGFALCYLAVDGSPVVRKELVTVFHKLTTNFHAEFYQAGCLVQNEELKQNQTRGPGSFHIISDSGANLPFVRIWKELLNLTYDPFDDVSRMAKTVVRGFSIPISARKRSLSRPVDSAGAHGASFGSDMSASTGNSPSAANGTVIRALSFGNRINQNDSESVPTVSSENPLGSASTAALSAANSIRNSLSPKIFKRQTSGGDTTKNDLQQQQPLNTRSPRKLRSNSGDLSNRILPRTLSNSSDVSFFDSVSLDSTILLRCCQLFRKTTKVKKDINTEEYLEAQWLQKRNSVKQASGASLENVSPGTGKNMMSQTATVHCGGGRAVQMALHPYVNELVVGDGKDTISIWDWKHHYRKCVFSNSNILGRKMTGIKYINEKTNAMLLTTTDDGVVRIWRNFSDLEKVEMVTSWRALSDVLPSKRDNEMLAEWVDGQLYVGGDTDIIRVWNSQQDQCVQQFPTQAPEGVGITSFSHHSEMGFLVAGFSNGSLRLYDYRSNEMVSRIEEHSSSILCAHFQKNSSNQFVTGSMDGQVKIFDIRNKKSLFTIDAHPSSNALSAMAVHNYAPLIATGTRTQLIKIFHKERSKPLATIHYHDGFLGQRIGPVSSLAFHAFDGILATGGGDSIVSIYKCTPYAN